MPRGKRSKKRGSGSTRPAQRPTVSRESSSILFDQQYIDNLTDDILRDIFATFTNESWINRHYTPNQLLLAAVCRRWRNLVLDTPLLWTSIYIPSAASFSFFERSQPALIDVCLNSISSGIQTDSDLLSRTSEAIANHVSRVRSLKVHVWESKEVYAVFHAWKDLEAVNLKNLTISSFNGSLNPPNTFPFPVFSSPTFTKFSFWQGGKSLSSLKLEGFGYQEFAPLPNLTSLEIDRLNTTPTEFQDLLASCPVLDKLIIHHFGAPSYTTDSSSPDQEIDVSSLRIFAVKIDSGHFEDCTCVLPILSLQNLEYLEVVFPWTISDPHLSLIASQWKKLPNLRKFVIRGPSIWANDISFLSDLPKSTELEIMNFPVDAEVALTYILNLSNLKSLTFDLTGAYMYHLDAKLFSDTISRQCLELQCPTAVRLSSTAGIDPGWLKLQASSGHKFSILAPDQKGLLENGVDYPFILDDEDRSPQWMTDDDFDDDSFPDEFAEYDEFDMYDRDEIEYLQEDDIYDEPYEYDDYE